MHTCAPLFLIILMFSATILLCGVIYMMAKELKNY
jgi:hypothetical protein